MLNNQNNNQTPYAFLAPEADAMLMALAKERKESKHLAINWDADLFPTFAKLAPPIFQGQTCVVQAASSEGKSLFAGWWARQVQDSLLLSGDKTAKILYVMLEESTELARSMTMRYPVEFKEISTGNADLEKVKVAIARSADDPIVYVGPSLFGHVVSPRAARFNGLRPVDLENIVNELKKEQGITVRACVIDYIQLMKDNKRSPEKVTAIGNASLELLDVQQSVLKCPTIICAQSKTEVKNRAGEGKIPMLFDVQWSSQIAQDSDISFGIWQPSTDYRIWDEVEVEGVMIPIFKDIHIMRVDKWRHATIKSQVIAFTSSYGGKYGNIKEVSIKDELSRVNVDLAAAEGISRYCDLTERHFN